MNSSLSCLRPSIDWLLSFRKVGFPLMKLKYIAQFLFLLFLIPNWKFGSTSWAHTYNQSRAMPIVDMFSLELELEHCPWMRYELWAFSLLPKILNILFLENGQYPVPKWINGWSNNRAHRKEGAEGTSRRTNVGKRKKRKEKATSGKSKIGKRVFLSALFFRFSLPLPRLVISQPEPTVFSHLCAVFLSLSRAISALFLWTETASYCFSACSCGACRLAVILF